MHAGSETSADAPATIKVIFAEFERLNGLAVDSRSLPSDRFACALKLGDLALGLVLTLHREK